MNESELARQFQISRAPIREALHQLQEFGLVTNHPRRGMFVVTLRQDDVRKMNHLRLVLEALTLCRKKFDPKLEKRLSAMVERMETMNLDPLSQQGRIDLEFHCSIWVGSGNEHLVRILVSLTTPLFAFVAESLMKGLRRKSALRFHPPFLEYLQERSKLTAEEIVLLHLKQGYDHSELE